MQTDHSAETRLLLRLVDVMPALAAFWDADERCTVSNRAHDEFFGYAPGSLVGTSLVDMLGEAYDKQLVELAAARRGEPQHFEARLTDASGRARQLSVHYLPEEDPAGFFVVCVDVSEQHEASARLRQAESIAGLGSWSAVDRGLPDFSPSMYGLLGRDAQTWTPTWDSIMELVHPEDRASVTSTVDAAYERGEGYELEYRVVRPDGDVRRLRARCDVEMFNDGTALRRVGTELDVTDARLTEQRLRSAGERLERLNQTQSDLIAMLGHDVKQPLTVVQGHLDRLREDWAELPDELREHSIERADVAAQRLGGLLDDVLTMANLESRSDGSVPTRTRATAVLPVVAEALASVLGSDAVSVVASGDPVACVDPWHLRQVVANLVVNALKYGAAPVEVAVRLVEAETPTDSHDALATSSQRVELSVTDSGEGVPASFLPRLFGRFERAGEGVAATKQGNGFGLYIVRRLVEANDGHVRHEPTGRGARFVVDLPAAG